MQRGCDGLKYGLIAWKSDPTLARNQSVTHPDGEFTSRPLDDLRFDAEFFFEQRRYPSSARRV